MLKEKRITKPELWEWIKELETEKLILDIFLIE
jgi:hypothetical protein